MFPVSYSLIQMSRLTCYSAIQRNGPQQRSSWCIHTLGFLPIGTLFHSHELTILVLILYVTHNLFILYTHQVYFTYSTICFISVFTTYLVFSYHSLSIAIMVICL